MRSSSAILVVLLLWLAACAAPPGTVVEDWEVAWPETPGGPESPEHPPPQHFLPPSPDGDAVFRATRTELWLRTRVDPSGLRDPVLFLPKAYVAVAAYVDGQRTYAMDDYWQAAGIPAHVVRLPPDRGPVEVQLRLRSRYTQIGLPEPARVGEHAALIADLLPRDLPRLAPGVLFFVVGVGALGLTLGRRERASWASLAAFSVGLCAWTLFHTRSKHLWLDHGPLWLAAWWIGVPLIGAGIAAFFDSVFGPGPWRFVRWIWWTLSVLTALAAGSLLLPEALFFALANPLYLAIRAVLLLGTPAVALWLAVLAWRGSVDARIVLLGYAVVAVGVVHDILISASVLSGDIWTHGAYVLVDISLILVVLRRIGALDRRVHRYAASLDRHVRQRDDLVRDLHDGLGGIVTNVRLLARRGSRRDADESLALIAELAEEGSHELRSLILGFEGLPETWSLLAAELRRSGGQRLEAHGLEHRFELDLQEDAPAPELAVVVHVSRIHREAVQNVIKHAEATRVVVRLEVGEARLRLTIHDDGRGSRPPSPDAPDVPSTGRGINSMRTRAQRLGGTLDWNRSGDGTRVHLDVPLGPD